MRENRIFANSTSSLFVAFPYVIICTELSTTKEAIDDDVNNPAYDPLNTTNNESEYIAFSMNCFVYFFEFKYFVVFVYFID